MVENREARFFYGYIIVASAFLILVLTIGVNTTFGVFLPALLDEFSWTRAIASGAFSLNYALTGLIGVFAGKINDQYGPRIIITVCGVLLGLGYLLMSQANTLWHLYLFYGVIVVGMQETNRGIWVPELMTPQQVSSFTQDDVAHWVNDYATPAVQFSIRAFALNSNEFIVIQVQEFDTFSCYLQKAEDFRGREFGGWGHLLPEQ